MNSKHIAIVLFAVCCSLASCTFGDHYDVDFSTIPTKQNWFQVTSQRETEISATDIPADCFLPDGTPLADYANTVEAAANVVDAAADTAENIDGNGVFAVRRRTNYVSGTSIVQNLFDYNQRKKVIELSGTYWSEDEEGNKVQLSGKVVIPSSGVANRIILVSHYTISSNREAPSNAFPLEAVLANMGYVMIFPDYLGYGITSDRIHPYLVMDVTARNVADMYLAVRPFLEAAGVEIKNKSIYLMGYSQGGATTMAVERYFERNYSDSVDIYRVFAGGGPYDVMATYDRFVTTDTAGYPVAVPLVMQGMIRGNHLNLNMQDLMQPYVYENLDKWINSMEYTTAEINGFIGTKVTHDILSEKGMDRTSAEVSELYKAMTQNSIISYSWTPAAPVYMFHSMDDETVTFVNASRAKSKWKDANIKYNFGHYGSHVQGCLRFIFSVKTLLQDDQDEEDEDLWSL